MAKNYADIYNSPNDSIGLEQRWYLKKETQRGELVTPGNSDFFYTLGGGSIKYSQPREDSPHRSGRHMVGDITKKKETSWSFSTFFNIDEALSAAAASQIDQPLRTLFESAFGKEETSPHLKYTTAKNPDLCFSLYEVGDKWARVSRGAFVDGCTLSFPGDGEAKAEWSGSAKDAFFVGIGKSTVNNATNTVTLEAGEGKAFRVGAPVMLIKADGVTRSSDTAAGTARVITAIAGDVVTLSGAPLTDADGSSDPVYLSYYEPSAPAAINNPVTGLVGSMAIAGVNLSSFRGATVTVANNHEKSDYYFGTAGLGGNMFVPAGKVANTVKIDMNVNAEVVRLFNRVQDFQAQSVTIVLGSAAGRRLEINCPKVAFSVPEIPVPDTGSVTVSFEGPAQASGVDAADEIAVELK